MILSPYFKEVLMDHLFSTASFAPESLYLGAYFASYYINKYGIRSSDPDMAELELDDSGYERPKISFKREEQKIAQDNNSFFLPLLNSDYKDCAWFIADAKERGQGNVFLLGLADPSGEAASSALYDEGYYEFRLIDDDGTMCYDIEVTVIERVYDDVTEGRLTSHALLSGMTHFLCRQGFPSPNTYIALLHEMPDGEIRYADDLSEISGTGYQRVKVNPAEGASPAWNFAVSGEISNSGEIVWNVGSSDWSEVVGCAVVTDEMSGEVLAVSKNSGFVPKMGRKIRFPSDFLIFGI